MKPNPTRIHWSEFDTTGKIMGLEWAVKLFGTKIEDKKGDLVCGGRARGVERKD